MSKRARNPDVPEISAATREAFKSELAQKMQIKAEHKMRRLGWGARLEAAAQAGTQIEALERAQKPEKAKKSKHKSKHKKHKKKHKRSSSDTDTSSQCDKQQKVKKRKTADNGSGDEAALSSENDDDRQTRTKEALMP